MAKLGFLKDFKKNISKLASVSVGLTAPKMWWSTGNYALNKILSGSYFKALPQGRIIGFVGPSGSGKSFLSSNVLKAAQSIGAHLLVIDSENALDTVFLKKIGMTVNDDEITYISVDTFSDVNEIISSFFKEYEKEHGIRNYDGPPVIILLDSIAMLSTDTERENYEKSGEVKGDQGQRAKQTKSMLRMALKKIQHFPAAMIVTDHVYPADPMKGEGLWAVTNGTRFFPTMIGLVTKLKLKEDTEVIGVRMQVETYKSRFAKLGSKVELEVPYTTGMSPYSGLLDSLEGDGVVAKSGAWYSIVGDPDNKKFQRKQLNEELVQKLLAHPIIQQAEKIWEDGSNDEDIAQLTELLAEEE